MKKNKETSTKKRPQFTIALDETQVEYLNNKAKKQQISTYNEPLDSHVLLR